MNRISFVLKYLTFSVALSGHAGGAGPSPWGTIGDFIDPDGNHCSLRDEGSFLPSVV